jgi:hypothetical protein
MIAVPGSTLVRWQNSHLNRQNQRHATPARSEAHLHIPQNGVVRRRAIIEAEENPWFTLWRNCDTYGECLAADLSDANHGNEWQR